MVVQQQLRSTLSVDGMTCQNSCGPTVARALKDVPGVYRAEASFAKGQAWAVSVMGLESNALVSALRSVGFEAKVTRVELELESSSSSAGANSETIDLTVKREGGSGAIDDDVNYHRRSYCSAATSEPSSPSSSASPPRAVAATLAVKGMMCQRICGSTVTAALRAVPGVSRAETSFSTATATVWGHAFPGDLIEAVEAVGFEASLCEASPSSSSSSVLPLPAPASASQIPEPAPTNSLAARRVEQRGMRVGADVCVNGDNDDDITDEDALSDDDDDADCDEERPLTAAITKPLMIATFSVAGMSCAACVRNVEERVAKVRGVTAVKVALLSERAEVEFHEPLASVDMEGREKKRKKKGESGYGRHDYSHQRRRERQEALGHDVGDDDESPTAMTILATINGLGYTARHLKTVGAGKNHYLKEVRLTVTGMTCAACSSTVEKVVGRMAGVVKVSASVACNKVKVTLNTSVKQAVDVRDVIDSITGLGYHAGLSLGGDVGERGATGASQGCGGLGLEDATAREVAKWRHLFLFSLTFAIPVLTLHMWKPEITLFGWTCVIGGLTFCDLIMFILATPVQVYVGYGFYRAAWLGLKHGSMGMDFLIVMGTSCAYLYSVCILIVKAFIDPASPHPCTFETAVMLLTFVTMGKFMEAVAKGQTTTSLRTLLSLQSQTAMLVNARPPAEGQADGTKDGRSAFTEEVRTIAVELIKPGDVLKVLPGTKVPTDGEVTYGQSLVDESMITGESRAVPKGVGDVVFGSSVNQLGCLYMKATRVGEDTALSQIVRLVQEAQTNKAPIQHFADRVASIFAPLVMLLAMTTFVVWYAFLSVHYLPSADGGHHHGSESTGEVKDPFLFSLLAAIAVTVVACPCALGLATPTAVMVGTGVGAANGVLIKGGSAFEMAHKVEVVVFDKTGTLTAGELVLTDQILLSSSVTPDGLLSIAASAESDSEHPLARAIQTAARVRGLQVTSPVDTRVLPGRGIKCRLQQRKIFVGNRQLMRAERITITKCAEKTMTHLEGQGRTCIIVAVNGEAVGVLALADQRRKEAKEAVSALHRMGVDVWMVTGDNLQTARCIATGVGIRRNRVLAEVLPAQKARKVQELQRAGWVVAHVGDGINDAPALASADVGIAIGAGTHVAIEVADMVLVSSNLLDVVTALHLSKCVFTRIRLNFVWALGYNVLAIPLAAGMLQPWFHIGLTPALASFFMACSSSMVVVSSLCLKLYVPPHTTTKLQQRRGQGGGCREIVQRWCSALCSSYSLCPGGNKSMQKTYSSSDNGWGGSCCTWSGCWRTFRLWRWRLPISPRMFWAEMTSKEDEKMDKTAGSQGQHGDGKARKRLSVSENSPLLCSSMSGPSGFPHGEIIDV